MAFAQEWADQALERQFRSAASEYEAGDYSQAAAQLESLLARVPKSFEIQELLGLAYAAQSQDMKAVEHLRAAVRIRPDSATARTNLAVNLSRTGDIESAEEQLRKALELEPRDYDANHDLAELYIQSGKVAEAIPMLERAQRARASSYDNGYNLAQAYFLTGKLDQARRQVKSLETVKNTGELHTLLGEIEEKDGKFLAAGNEYETAARMDPSEETLFDWGSELLLHWAYAPALTVFEEASARYPHSVRVLVGRGVAQYFTGKYDQAIESLLSAADLSPADPGCYAFLFKVYDHFPRQAGDVTERFRRYAELRPNNALAQYYYAISLWKGDPADSGPRLLIVESLLQRSIALDPKLAEASYQLGNLYSDKQEYAKALPEYQRALQLNPGLPGVHYQLGRCYARVGQKDMAQQELATYQRLRAQHLAEDDKAGEAIQQFVFAAKASSEAKE
jgi:tetratricopeptide (TPR) repeat protein